MGRILFSLLVLVLLGTGIVAGGMWWVDKRYQAPGPLAEETMVQVPEGAGLKKIVALLQDKGVLGPPPDNYVFEYFARKNDTAKKLRAGEFAFPAHASIAKVMDVLLTAAPVTYSVTFPEGWTTEMILARLKKAPHLTGEITLEPAEGTLLPDTYSYQRGDSRDDLIRRMQQAMNDTLAEEWADRSPDLPLKTPQEALILASIVEKETGVRAERAKVASVFVNRLRKNMRLQTDPTVIYAVSGGQPLGRGLKRSELNLDHPYNTYQIRGLPPGPIANPGRAAIEASLHPAETDYLYFVADGTGGHVFAQTLAEHNRNVVEWRKIEAERRARQQAAEQE